MTLEEAIKIIIDNWDKLENDAIEGIEAVWFYLSSHSFSYDIDDEKIGVKKDGKLVWAFASGCSCWDGSWNTEECPTKDMKVFEFQHEDTKEEWEQALIKFAQEIK